MSRPVTGTVHHAPFYAVQPGTNTPINLVYATFGGNIAVDFFTVTNGNSTIEVSSAVKKSLKLIYVGSGFYQFEYVPDVPGYYLLAATSALLMGTYIKMINGVDVDSEDAYVLLTQATPPGLVPNVVGPQNYILMLFLSSDWQVGRYNPLYAVASTQLDSQGNWLSTPLTVQHGTYHVVVQANNGTQVVIAAFLEV